LKVSKVVHLTCCSSKINLDGESGEDIKIDDTQDAFTATPDIPDPYDKVYSNILKETHFLSHPVSAFRNPGVPGPTSKLSPRAPAQMGRRETERELGRQQEGDGRERWKSRSLRVCPAPRSGALAVGGYKRPRGRERAASRERHPIRPRAAHPL
jgi:hypothetical protein